MGWMVFWASVFTASFAFLLSGFLPWLSLAAMLIAATGFGFEIGRLNATQR